MMMLWLSGGGTRSFPHDGTNELATFMRCQRDWLAQCSVETWHFHSWTSELLT